MMQTGDRRQSQMEQALGGSFLRNMLLLFGPPFGPMFACLRRATTKQQPKPKSTSRVAFFQPPALPTATQTNDTARAKRGAKAALRSSPKEQS